MQAIFGDNGQHLLCSSCLGGSECVKCGYGLCYMQPKYETVVDHFLTLTAEGRRREEKKRKERGGGQEYLGCQKYTFCCHSLVSDCRLSLLFHCSF